MNETDLVKEWFDIASIDLQVAAHLFNTMHPKPLEIVCYHCQQAAEKALKGFLTDRGIEPPYTHDLEQLRLMCIEYDSSFSDATIQKASLKLSEYAVSTRYPDRPEIEEQDAAFALEEADKIYSLCANLIPALKIVIPPPPVELGDDGLQPPGM